MFKRLKEAFEARVQQYRYDHATSAVRKIVDLAKSQHADFNIAANGSVQVRKNQGTPAWQIYNYDNEGRTTSKFSRGFSYM